MAALCPSHPGICSHPEIRMPRNIRAKHEGLPSGPVAFRMAQPARDGAPLPGAGSCSLLFYQPPGPGIMVVPPAHGSQGGHACSTVGIGQALLLQAPRWNQRQHWQPTELLVINTKTDKISNLFIISISNRSVIFSSRIFRHVNSTPHPMMCKFNEVFFFNNN